MILKKAAGKRGGGGGKATVFLRKTESRILSVTRAFRAATARIEFCFPRNISNSCLAVPSSKFYALLAEDDPEVRLATVFRYTERVYAFAPPPSPARLFRISSPSFPVYFPPSEREMQTRSQVSRVLFQFRSETRNYFRIKQTLEYESRRRGSLLKFSFGSRTETERTRYGFNSGARL